MVQICLHEHLQHCLLHDTNMPTWAQKALHATAHKALHFTWCTCTCMSTWSITFAWYKCVYMRHKALHGSWSKCSSLSTWSITFCLIQMCLLHEHIKHYMQQHIRYYLLHMPAWAHEALPSDLYCTLNAHPYFVHMELLYMMLGKHKQKCFQFI